MGFGFRVARVVSWLLLASSAWAQQPDVLELRYEDLPRLLAERNRNIQGAILVEEAANKRTGFLARSFLPQLFAGGGVENFQTGIYRRLTQPYGWIETRINLFQGGRDYFEEQVRVGEALSARSESAKIRNDELMEARHAYWELLFQEEAIGFFKKALELNEKYLTAANRRIQRGLTTSTDRLDFEINRDVLKEELESLEHEVLLVEIKIRGLLSTSESQKFKGVGLIPHDHDESLLKVELDPQSSSALMELQAAEQITQARSSSRHRWWLPSLNAYGGYYLYTLRDRDYLDQSLRSDTVVGIQLVLPIFDGFESGHEAAAAGKQAAAQENRAFQETRKAQTRLKALQEEMKHLHDLIHNGEKRIDMGQGYLKSTLGDYDRGVKNSVDVLGALQRLIQFQRRYAELRRDYQISKAELLGMLGK